MNPLIDLVAEKAGISPDQAKTAVDTVLQFLKERLPGPFADQLDGVLEGRSLGDAIKHLRAAMGGS